MTARKLKQTNPADIHTAYRFTAYGEPIHLETGALKPDERAGCTTANMIPGLNSTDWQDIYDAVNEAVEKAAQGDPDPEEVLLFEISGYSRSPRLAVVELHGYTPTNPGCWTTARVYLVSLGE